MSNFNLLGCLELILHILILFMVKVGGGGQVTPIISYWSALAIAPTSALAGAKEASNFTELFCFVVLSCCLSPTIKQSAQLAAGRDLCVQLYSHTQVSETLHI